jgi:alpha/beta superfamily hydrolase
VLIDRCIDVVSGDLVTDAETAFNYLLMTGVKSKNILIHGHSLGGAVGALLRQKHPEVTDDVYHY